LEAKGQRVEWFSRKQSHGIAEQRDFLLRQATSEAVLFLDDDVWMEPWVLARLAETLRKENIGFVGAFPAGLSFRTDISEDEQKIEFWKGPVVPEKVTPGSSLWRRSLLHRAANLWHVARRLPNKTSHLYKIAWVASCVLYDRKKLLSVGGFSFWPHLPRYHSGEDVLVQNLLMRRYGGCCVIPSGTYHSEVSSTVLNAGGSVDGHALELLEGMVKKYADVKIK